MADYSNIRIACFRGLPGYVRRGGRMSDQMLFEAVDMISPPLLPEREMQALRRELKPKPLQFPARPRAGTARGLRLAALIEAQQRIDVPQEILNSLLEWLRAKRRFTEAQQLAPWAKLSKHRNRDSLICGLYRGIKELLEAGPPYHHEVLGELDAGLFDLDLSQSDQALSATKMIMLHRLGIATPALGRMRNIISERNFARIRE